MTRSAARVEVACLSHSPGLGRHLDQGLMFRAGSARLAKSVEEFDPTLVIFFGPDHRRALTSFVPCFTLAESAVGFGDWGTTQDAYDVPRELTRNLVRYLVSREFDVALATGLPIDHAFAQPACQLFGTIAKVPIIPIVVNCIGLPMASLRRTAALGQAVGDFLRSDLKPTERVLVIASGGLSHSPPPLLGPGVTPDMPEEWAALTARARALINLPWDESFLARLASNDWQSLASMSDEDIMRAGPGAHEVRTWVAAIFAGREPLQQISYEAVPSWFTGMGVAATGPLVSHQ